MWVGMLVGGWMHGDKGVGALAVRHTFECFGEVKGGVGSGACERREGEGQGGGEQQPEAAAHAETHCHCDEPLPVTR